METFAAIETKINTLTTQLQINTQQFSQLMNTINKMNIPVTSQQINTSIEAYQAGGSNNTSSGGVL